MMSLRFFFYNHSSIDISDFHNYNEIFIYYRATFKFHISLKKSRENRSENRKSKNPIAEFLLYVKEVMRIKYLCKYMCVNHFSRYFELIFFTNLKTRVYQHLHMKKKKNADLRRYLKVRLLWISKLHLHSKWRHWV